VLNSVVLFVAPIIFVVVSAKALREKLLPSLPAAFALQGNTRTIRPFAVIVYLFLLPLFLFSDSVSNATTWYEKKSNILFL
jgi:hypothetical protein